MMNLKISVLGPNVVKCNKLFENVQRVCEKHFPNIVLHRDMDSASFEMHSYMFLPLLIINGKVVSRGAVLSEREILFHINEILPAHERVSVDSKTKSSRKIKLGRWPLALAICALLIFMTRFFNGDTDDSVAIQNTKPMMADSVNSEYNYVANGKDYSITFLEFGSGQCRQCKMMEKVLDSIRQEFPKVVNVVFVDVRDHKNDSLADYFKIKLIPSQVLLDAKAKEFYRHVGYIPADSLSMIINEDIETHE